jgi:hypothetical protein
MYIYLFIVFEHRNNHLQVTFTSLFIDFEHRLFKLSLQHFQFHRFGHSLRLSLFPTSS